MDANVDVLAYMELISNTGFPIVIAMYLLHRMEKNSMHLSARLKN